MIPWALLPASGTWSGALEALAAREAPLWVWGEAGTGVSALGAHLAALRGAAFLDDADRMAPEGRRAWVEAHPKGVLASHGSPGSPALAAEASRCLVLRLAPFEEDPAALPACLEAMAREEGVEGPPPSALASLPCPGNLRGLRNRLVRWRLLGQVPEGEPAALPLAEDDLARNLHVLERMLVHRALRRSLGNRMEAARRLGVSRGQLYLLVARHGDPVRGEAPRSEGPARLTRSRARQNSSPTVKAR